MAIHVKRELILSYGAVALATVLMGGTALWAQSRAADELDTFMQGLNRRAQTSVSLEIAMKDRAITARNLLLATSDADRTKAAEGARAHHAEVQRLMAEYKGLVERASDMSDEARRLAREIGAVEAEYSKVALAIVDMAVAGQRDEAIDKLNSQCVPLLARLDQVMEAYTRLTRQREQELIGHTEAQLAQQRVVVGLLALLVVSVAVTAAVLITRRLLHALGAEPLLLGAAASRVAEGDLAPIAGADRAPPGSVLDSMARMQNGLLGLVRGVRSTADSIATASGQIASGNQDLSGRTEQQAAALQQTAAQMHQMTDTVRGSAESARAANALANEAAEVAGRGGAVVDQVVTTMDEITRSSQRIGDIIGVIDGIAFQTNILALNAAVEAARAGEQGRGFAVVAGEVRALAQRSADAAREIKGLIGASVERVEQGGRLVGEAGQTMREIVDRVRRVNDLIGEIHSAAELQTSGIEQVNHAVSSLDQGTQQNAALVEQSAAAAESLRQQADELMQRIGAFRAD